MFDFFILIFELKLQNEKSDCVNEVECLKNEICLSLVNNTKIVQTLASCEAKNTDIINELNNYKNQLIDANVSFCLFFM